jgi:hypothetical protein
MNIHREMKLNRWFLVNDVCRLQRLEPKRPHWLDIYSEDADKYVVEISYLVGKDPNQIVDFMMRLSQNEYFLEYFCAQTSDKRKKRLHSLLEDRFQGLFYLAEFYVVWQKWNEEK